MKLCPAFVVALLASASLTWTGCNTLNQSAAAAPCSNCASLQISPSNPSVAAGGTLQFSAVAGSATGAPVTWSASAGTISPEGLFTAPSQTSAYSILVKATTAGQNPLQASTAVTINDNAALPNSACGPPAYSCSRTDLEIVQLPQTPPDVGNLSGGNTVVTDSDFGNRIVRITDANTNPESNFKNRSYVSSSSGSADVNVWNLDSTLLVVQDTGANSYPFTFNSATLQASRMYVSNYPSTKGMMIPASGEWSRVNPNLFYTFSGTEIAKYDFSDRSNPPSSQPVYNFTSSPNCLPARFTATWSTEGGVSGDDTVFAMAYSNNGNQGSGVYALAYKVGSGCTMLNTQTGEVSGDWGAKGTIDIPDRWTIHNVKLSKDGNWLVIVSTTCLSSTCATGPYFWQIGTTTVNSCSNSGSCSGHWTEGYTHWVNNDNSPMANQVIRAFSQTTPVSDLIATFPLGITAPLDQHQSWNNADPTDTVPFLSSTWSTTTPFPAPWYNEVIGVAANGIGTTWRFAHNFITARSQRFSTEYGIGSVSQDGKFFLLSSDWMGTLGSESGSSTCTIGTNCRGDVFVVELK